MTIFDLSQIKIHWSIYYINHSIRHINLEYTYFQWDIEQIEYEKKLLGKEEQFTYIS